MTGHNANDENADDADEQLPLPYEKCAKRALTEAKANRCHQRQVLQCEQEMNAFGDDWHALPNKIDSMLRMIQDDLDDKDSLDVEQLHDMVDSLPLPPGALGREEWERQERITKLRDLADEDSWDDEPECLPPAEKKRLTQAIWGVRSVCEACQGSGYSKRAKTCPACGGFGRI